MDSRHERLKEIILFSHPSMNALARNIEQKCIESKFSSRLKYKEDGIIWGNFKDGFPNLFIKNVKDIACKHVFLLASFHSPEVIFEQVSLIYALPRYMVKSLSLVLPYFPTGTMERIDLEGQIATAKTLAQLLSATPLSTQGPVQVIIFDIHALQERFYFGDTLLPRLETAVPLMEEKIRTLMRNGEKVVIAFPDEGAQKRFNPWLKSLSDTLFEDFRVTEIICSKFRDGDKRSVKISQGDPAGRHVVIVDDLVQSGSTILECSKKLLEQGASKVSAYVTHAVFPRQSWKQFVEDPVVKLENFWVTDSIPHARDICQHPPFKLISLDTCVFTLLTERCL